MPVLPMLASESQLAHLLSALGIDWRSLIFNIIAFLIMVGILGKFVYPTLIKALDVKKSQIEDAARLKTEAEQALAASHASAETIIEEARQQSQEIVASARHSGAAIVRQSEEKATVQAHRIVESAHLQLERDVNSARLALRSETARLVAQATERVLNEKINQGKDTSIIKRVLAGKL